MKKILLMIILCITIITGCQSNTIDITKATEIEEKLYRVGGPSLIESDFDAYYQLKNSNKQAIPLLLHVKIHSNYNEGRISDSTIMEIVVVGNNNELTLQTSFDDEDCFSKLVYVRPLIENEIVVPNHRENEVAFLKEKFNEQVVIKEVSNDLIKYKIENQINDYMCLVRITRNSRDGKLNITVVDESVN